MSNRKTTRPSPKTPKTHKGEGKAKGQVLTWQDSLEWLVEMPWSAHERLAVFRMGFGLLLTFQLITWITQDVASAFWLYPSISFRFDMMGSGVTGMQLPSLETVTHLMGCRTSDPARWLLNVMLGSLAGVSALWSMMSFRSQYGSSGRQFLEALSLSVLLVGYAWFFSLDRSFYNNHNYLYLLVLWLFWVRSVALWLARAAGVPSFSTVDDLLSAHSLKTLRILIQIVYIFAGTAKLTNVDWVVRAEPLLTWFFRGSESFWPPLFRRWPLTFLQVEDWGYDVQFFCAQGMVVTSIVVDLVGGAMLGVKNVKVRSGVLGVFGLFHLFNSMFFSIEQFPYVMMWTTFLWIGTDYDRPTVVESPSAFRFASLFRSLMIAFLVLMVALPLRHLALSDNVNWSNNGHYFSWRMMLNQENVLVRFYITGQSTSVQNMTSDSFMLSSWRARLIPHQQRQMRYDPLMLERFSKKYAGPLGKQVASYKKSHVYIDAWRSVNGQPFQRWVDGSLDFASDLSPSFPLACRLLNCFPEEWVLPPVVWLPAVNQMTQNVNRKIQDTERFWADRNHYSSCFVARLKDTWTASFTPFAETLLLQHVHGDLFFFDHAASSTHLISDETLPHLRIREIPFESWHSLETQSDLSAWCYIYPAPRYSFSKALDM